MALLREHTADEYWPDSGILVVRDQGPWADSDPAELLTESAIDTQPGGTVAHAGAGWLWASTSSDSTHTVRLEAHDGPPPDDVAEWDDVLETPFQGGATTIGLGLLTGGEFEEHTLLLGRHGYYRVRVSCRREPDAAGEDAEGAEGAEGDLWRLQFWPVPADPEPPRWLARGTPAVGEFSYEWEEVLDYEVRDVLWGAQIAAREHPRGATTAQVAAAKPGRGDLRKARPEDPLWSALPPPPLTTGHPDQDAFEERNHAEIAAERAGQERALAELAARFGVPAPVTVADVLPLLVRLGLLTVREDGGERRYLAPADQPHVRDVLDLPAERLAAIDEQQLSYRYGAPATDLVAVALWTPDGRVGTAPDLTARVLMPVSELRATLRFAIKQRLLQVDGDPDDDASQLTLTVLPRPELRPEDPPPAEEPNDREDLADFRDLFNLLNLGDPSSRLQGLPHVIEEIGIVQMRAEKRAEAPGHPERCSPACQGRRTGPSRPHTASSCSTPPGMCSLARTAG